MKKILFSLAMAASIAVAVAQTQPKKKATKECCKKEGAGCCKKEKSTVSNEASCCSPSSKAKALSKAKPSSEKKG